MKSYLIIIGIILQIGFSNSGVLRAPDLERKIIEEEKQLHPSDRYLPSNQNNFKFKREGEEKSEFWLNMATDFVQEQLKKKRNYNKAKNVVIFLGDGMGVATIAAARVYMGGEEIPLAFEDFPFSGLSKTYSVDTQVSDSASTATAYLTGVKTNYGVLGLNARVPRYDCQGQLDPANHTHSIGKWAMDAGKVAGIVTTTKVTDASPGGIYAHIGNRYWENNQDIEDSNCDSTILDDVAKQLVFGEEGRQLRVILGGGRREFRTKGMVDEERHTNYRTDGRDLIQEWLDSKEGYNRSYVWNTEELLAVNANETDYLMGLFEGSHCRYHLEVVEEEIEHLEPTLAQMTEKAIDILSKHEEGFFLFVEGGRIDLAHHGSYARIALDETAEFSKAIEVARKKLSNEDTLFVVTADHSHGFSYAGYAYRSNDIFGTAQTHEIVYDKIPYLTLNYFDGPGNYNFMNKTGVRNDPTKYDREEVRFQYPANVYRSTASHGGEDVILFADGPWSHLFTGVLEENVIPYIMAYAACIGDGLKMCDDN